MNKLNYLLGAAAAFLLPSMAFAEEAAASADKPMYALAKGFAVGIAALGCALGQGKIFTTALHIISLNPCASRQIFTPMLLCMTFIETLLIFTLFLSGIAA